jgi:hypothetical protein
MYLSKLAANAKALIPLELFAEVIEENKEYIADLNTSQLEKGKDSNDENISPDYLYPEYAKLKMSMGSQAPLGVPNLKLTGEFHEGFFAEPGKDGGIFISSKDSKTGKLTKKYSTNIFGLMDKSKADLKTVTLPNFLTKIRHELFTK